MALMDAYGLELVSVETLGLAVGRHQPGDDRRRPGRRPLGPRPVAAAADPARQPHQLDGVLGVHDPLVDRAADRRHGRVAGAHAGDRGRRADRAPAGRSRSSARAGCSASPSSSRTPPSPVTAFLIGPLAEAVLMPFMTDGAGADAIGGWFGTGPEPGPGPHVHRRRPARRRRHRAWPGARRSYRRLRAARGRGHGRDRRQQRWPRPDAPAPGGPTPSPATPSAKGAAGAPVPAG